MIPTWVHTRTPTNRCRLGNLLFWVCELLIFLKTNLVVFDYFFAFDVSLFVNQLDTGLHHHTQRGLGILCLNDSIDVSHSIKCATWMTASTSWVNRLVFSVHTACFWKCFDWGQICRQVYLPFFVSLVLLLYLNLATNSVFHKTLNLPVILQLLIDKRHSFVCESQTAPLVNHLLENLRWLSLYFYILKCFLNVDRWFVVGHFHLSLLSILQSRRYEFFLDGFLMSVTNYFFLQHIFNMFNNIRNV